MFKSHFFVIWLAIHTQIRPRTYLGKHPSEDQNDSKSIIRVIEWTIIFQTGGLTYGRYFCSHSSVWRLELKILLMKYTTNFTHTIQTDNVTKPKTNKTKPHANVIGYMLETMVCVMTENLRQMARENRKKSKFSSLDFYCAASGVLTKYHVNYKIHMQPEKTRPYDTQNFQIDFV